MWIIQLWTWKCTNIFEINILFPVGICSEVEFLFHFVVSFLISWGTFRLFSIVAVSFCILTPTLWKLPQLLNLSKIWCSPFICCCYFCFSDKIYVKCHLTMVLVFILEWLMYITSHIIICLSCSFFGEVSVHLFCCLFIWVSYFLIFVYSVILKYSGYILHLTSDLPIFCIFFCGFL